MPTDMTDDELFRPLSAKTARPKFATGGRPIKGRHADCGEMRKIRAAIARRKKDAARSTGRPE